MKNKTSILIYTFIIMGVCSLLTFGCKKEGNNYPSTVSDIDGNIYNTVKIGSQVWMKENLKTAKYRNGTAIPNITDSLAWEALTTAAWSYFDNDSSNNAVYGKLYNWFAVNTGILCPTGWHVPSDVEWTTLATYLGGDSIAGGKLKESGLSHWLDPNIGANNSSGFTGLAGGGRNNSGTFYYFGQGGLFWSSTGEETNSAWTRLLYYYDDEINRGNSFTQYGMSVRCLRD